MLATLKEKKEKPVMENSIETSRRVSVLDLQPHQVAQVFGDEGIRSIPAQHGWMRQHARAPGRSQAETTPGTVIPPYEYSHETGELVVYKATRISKDSLFELLRIATGKTRKA